MSQRIFAALSFILLIGIARACLASDPKYFGLRIPEGTPQRFEPAIFAGLGVLKPANPAFSTDFKRFAFTTANTVTPAHMSIAIFESRFGADGWSIPAHVRSIHQEGFNNADPSYSPDGRWLYFTSTRPPGAPPWNAKVFRAPLTETGYGTVELVDLALPGPAGIFYPQLTSSGSLLLTTDGLPGKGRGDIYVAQPGPGGTFASPGPAGADFNSERDDWDLAEHPDGRVRMWASARDGGAGRVDIYMSRQDSGDTWSPAKNVAALNTAAVETAPRFSPDGEVLFFQRIVDGRDRIYWVKAASILYESQTTDYRNFPDKYRRREQ